MDIWIGRCNKPSTCSYCGDKIEVGEAEVFGRLWSRRKGDSLVARRWVRTFHWHTKRPTDGICCWLQQGLENLANNPHVETRGRKKLLLPSDERLKRLRLLQKRAKVLQQIRTEMDKEPEDRNIDEIIRLGGIIEELKTKIAPLGGIPEGWK